MISSGPELAPGEVDIEPRANDAEYLWQSFWYALVTRKDGSVDIEQVKKELADYYRLMQTAHQVVMHATDNRIGNVMTDVNVIKAVMDDVFTEAVNKAVEERLREKS